ncbi:MAG: zinc ABC transporter substrate-binding protein [Hormoscilla sp. SP12CHS1]|nr:zinc ABC transporter substrate-binding protein [Hormoscilla sp. SP12CHS1]
MVKKLLKQRRYLFSLLAFLASISLTNVACRAQSGAPKIVATFLPIYMFTRAVAGEEARVEILIPPGVEVHDYQATPGNVGTVAQADVLVMNGLGMEEFLERLVENTGNRKLKEIDASTGIEPLKDDEDDHEDDHDDHDDDQDDDHDDHDDDHDGHDHDDDHDDHDDDHDGHDHAEGNPHVWLDPVLAQQQVANIRDGLIAADPVNAQTYRDNAEAYILRLQKLDREFERSQLGGCRFITFHDAYPYLAKRYGLQQMAVVELPEDNLTPRDLQRVIEAAKEFQVKALLSDSVENRRIQQIAKQVGVPVKILDPIESGPADPQYYFQAMRQNLQTLETVCR